MCEREGDLERTCVSAFARVYWCVCLFVSAAFECVCIRVYEIERYCICVCMRERKSVCVCVFVRVRVCVLYISVS